MEGRLAVTHYILLKTMDLAADPLMTDMRQSIDRFDTAFLNLLSERMRTVDRIIALKQHLNIDLQQSTDRKEDMRELIEMSVQLKLEPHFFKTILDLVFQDALSRRREENAPDGADSPMKEEAADLENMRLSLLNLDKSLCLVLAERFCIVKRIGKYKEQLNIPPLDASRWQQVLDDKAEKARVLGLSIDLTTNIYNAIHEVALALEEDVKTR